MAKKGSLLSFRPDIKVVDATIRDGGLVNDFRFTDEFVKELYRANAAAGIDYMEFGYKASKDIFDENAFGDRGRNFLPLYCRGFWQLYRSHQRRYRWVDSPVPGQPDKAHWKCGGRGSQDCAFK